jgi:hypothetical protein
VDYTEAEQILQITNAFASDSCGNSRKSPSIRRKIPVRIREIPPDIDVVMADLR